MTTILLSFLTAFFLTLLITPLVIRIAQRFGLVDHPTERKIHTVPIPRIGGLAIFSSFFLSLGLLYLFRQYSDPILLLFNDSRIFKFSIGAVIIFALGMVDDIRGLSFKVKFAGQIFVGVVAWYCGLRIGTISFPFIHSLSLGYFSLPATMFWFVLVINAINLVDGLDGLAAGIALFVCLTMLFICAPQSGLITTTLAFDCLAGCLLGFLRYNFNPATIFMGDSGSYFIGYSLAALSIAGSMKGQVATAMLIPVIAMGVPLFDALWAPLRRFVLGKKMFMPDMKHFHHNLVKMGYTQRRAVLFLYSVTIVLGLGAIMLVHARDDTAAFIMTIMGLGVIFMARYLGIPESISMGKLLSWAQDISDEAGISHDRRRFLNHQLQIAKAGNLDELWSAVCQSLADLEFDTAEFISTLQKNHPSKQEYSWNRSVDGMGVETDKNYLLKIELPLHRENGNNPYKYGTLLLIKDMYNTQTSQYTLKRVEHLRRTMVSSLEKIHP